jgi:putative ABC transport system permease protein
MLSTRWRKVLRDLWGNKARTVLVILSIAVGVFAVGMIAGSQTSFSQGLNGAWTAAHPPGATLYTDLFDDELLWTVRKMEGVQEADGRRQAYVRFRTDPQAEQWRDIQLFAYPDYENIRVQQVWSERGDWPPPDKEVLIERASLAWMGVQVGDAIFVEAPNGTLRELRVAGTAHDISMMDASWNDAAAGYINLETLSWFGLSRDFDELNLVIAGDATDREHVARVTAEVRDRVEKTGRTVYGTWLPTPGEHPAEEVVQPIIMLLGALGLLALLLSGFLVINTLQALLAQQVRQIGIMKAVGGRNGQIGPDHRHPTGRAGCQGHDQLYGRPAQL